MATVAKRLPNNYKMADYCILSNSTGIARVITLKLGVLMANTIP